VVFGDAGNDVINAGSGNDRAYGGTGDDLLYGGSGNDQLFGGEDNDRLEGQSGNDILRGENGNDALYGSAGFDIMYGDAGDDYLNGGNDADRMYGGTGNDSLRGGNQDDWLYGGDGVDDIRGGNHNDKLVGGAGIDKLRGESGDDILIYDSDDRYWGGSGFDWIVLNETETGNLNFASGKFKSGIEGISLENENGGAQANNLTINAADVLSKSDLPYLFVAGDNGLDGVLSTDFDVGDRIAGDANRGGRTYAHFNDSGADIYIELGIDLNGITIV
jgi:Ca2+-binding RTX toxin-like protein